jgi:hypothetical protein
MYDKLQFVALDLVGSHNDSDQLKFILQWLSSRKTVLDVMPPFDLVAFVRLPTKQHDTAVAHGRKIDQTLVIVLELNAQALELASISRKFDQQPRVARALNKTAAAALGADGSLFGRRLKGDQSTVTLLNRSYDWADAGQQRVGLFDGEKLHRN